MRQACFSRLCECLDEIRGAGTEGPRVGHVGAHPVRWTYPAPHLRPGREKARQATPKPNHPSSRRKSLLAPRIHCIPVLLKKPCTPSAMPSTYVRLPRWESGKRPIKFRADQVNHWLRLRHNFPAPGLEDRLRLELGVDLDLKDTKASPVPWASFLYAVRFKPDDRQLVLQGRAPGCARHGTA